MRIYNIRGGFANNSSSTHSLVFVPEGTPNNAGNTDDMTDNELGHFGWQPFLAASSEMKARWLAQHFIRSAQVTCGEAITRAMVQHWLGFDPAAFPDDHVDHQSLIALPREWGGVGVNVEFFNELKALVMQPGVAVLGGNDNDTSPVGDVNYREAMRGMVDLAGHSVIVARKDSRGFWTIFDRHDGTKFRVAFGEKTIERLDAAGGVYKTDTPELVDVKITNKCHMGCEFCYQSSVPSGAHADPSWLYAVTAYLHHAQVFEVAIGGGEPTLHPGFIHFLRSCRHNGVVPNFTTRNLTWLREPRMAFEILDLIGGWAFSTEDASAVLKLHALCVASGVPDNKMPAIQYVVGVGTVYDYENVVQACRQTGLRLTLLGPKDVGRGLTKTWTTCNWLAALTSKDGEHLQFGIDTALAQQYGQAIKDAGIPDWCYTTQEGKTSMYIDAVAGVIAPSSYCKPEQQVKVKESYWLTDTINQHYPTW